jgi:RNA polymerase sigma-70 factor, ECF subfamily
MRTEHPGGDELLARAVQGDAEALGSLFAVHRGRLRRMVQLRLDRRLQGRVDPSDVLQDAFLEVSRCLPDYANKPILPFFLWRRLLTGRKLQALHRYHLGTRRPSASGATRTWDAGILTIAATPHTMRLA